MANLSDFLIFYLACGASFGASYFFQHRKKFDQRTLWLKTFLTFFVWIPYALKFLHEFVTRKFPDAFFISKSSAHERLTRDLKRIEKDFAELIEKGELKVNIFEFRETYSRYAGLSAARLSILPNDQPAKKTQDFFRLTAHPNPPLGAQCLFRRNAQKLRRHQQQAGSELLALLHKSGIGDEHASRLRHLTKELFALFADAANLKRLDEIVRAGSQTRTPISVPVTEKEIWKTVSIQRLQNLTPRPTLHSNSIARRRKG